MKQESTTDSDVLTPYAFPNLDEQIQTAVGTFSATYNGIAALAEQAADVKIEGVDDREGFKQVTTVRKSVKAVRVEVEKTRKTLNEAPLAYQRAVNDEAKRITMALETIELPLLEQEREYKDARAEIKALEAAKRQEILDDRLAALFELKVNLPLSQVSAWTEAEFCEVLAELTRGAEEVRAKQDAEKAKEKAAQAEASAAYDEQQAALTAEREALAKEREAAKAAAEELRDAQAKAEASDSARKREEEQRAAAKARAKLEKDIEAQRKKDAAEKQAKREAARPDADKVRLLAVSMTSIDVPEFTDSAVGEKVLDVLCLAADALVTYAKQLDGGAA